MRKLTLILLLLLTATVLNANPVGFCPEEDGELPVLLPDDIHCEVFYVCDSGVPVAFECQGGTFFNCASNVCVFPEDMADCPCLYN
ncbi:Chitin binding Peritrophin-A domain-containing protein [Filimonas lacunae]|uniref:Chitin binding Peritrophin-A domain-containing protein n=1 Tax=Filimonas lacunae TaxID=477680 RepID=A0A1N7QLR4_9BACT|nr:chitin binding peritrophin-A domain-containing protein [Filimonas lacunae]SIT23812.1 Chitin binding Peritrophin-A domain-containing protein [Filimonas lacunae]